MYVPIFIRTLISNQYTKTYEYRGIRKMTENSTLQQLKEMVGNDNNTQLFQRLLASLSNTELLDLEEFIMQSRELCEEYIYKCKQRLRELNTTAVHLREEFKIASDQAQKMILDLKAFFDTVYKAPKVAQENCWNYEKENGVDSTARTVRKHPEKFGTLNGFNVFGMTFGAKKLQAQHQAVQTNYADMRRKLDEARENMHYIRMVFKGA
jgi:hypothetical protein